MQRGNVNIESPFQRKPEVLQGSIIGRLFFLSILETLALEPIGSPTMYADDTNVTFAASNMTDLDTQINSELKSINLWLRANKLSLNVAKTKCVYGH